MRLESSRSMGLDSLRDLLRETMHAGKNPLSPITLATPEAAIYSYTYVYLCGNAIICNFATQPCSILNNRVLLYAISSCSVITCIIVTLYGIVTLSGIVTPYGKLSLLSPQTRKHISNSLQTLKDIYLTFVHRAIQGSL